MPSLIDIRRRIRSVKSTQQITKAMKMISTARLRRAQERVVSARPYSRMAGEILRNVAAAAASDERVQEHPLLAHREEKTIQLILVTSDRGLAGGFNTNLIKAAQLFLDEHKDSTVEIELVGRKGRDHFVRRPVKVSGELVGVSQNAGTKEATELSDKAIRRFSEAEVDSVYLLYNEFKSILSQKVALKKVLPVAVEASEGAGRDYLFEQPPAEMLGRLLPKYVFLQLLEALLESAAAEHAARMTAMDSASNNAADVINKLTLHMNRVRQASITNEIIEVVSGASALE